MLPESWMEMLECGDERDSDYDTQEIGNRMEPYLENVASEGKYNHNTCVAFTVSCNLNSTSSF